MGKWLINHWPWINHLRFGDLIAGSWWLVTHYGSRFSHQEPNGTEGKRRSFGHASWQKSAPKHLHSERFDYLDAMAFDLTAAARKARQRANRSEAWESRQLVFESYRRTGSGRQRCSWNASKMRSISGTCWVKGRMNSCGMWTSLGGSLVLLAGCSFLHRKRVVGDPWSCSPWFI